MIESRLKHAAALHPIRILRSNRIPAAMAASTTTKTQRVEPEPGLIPRQIHVMQKVIAKKVTLPKEPDLLNRYWS